MAMKTQTLPDRGLPTLLQLKKILVPTDFSEASNSAYKYALRFGQQFDAELHIVHVSEPILSPQLAGLPPMPTFSEEERSLAENNLRVWADSMERVGVKTETMLRTGLAAHEIVEAAKEIDADLIVIATHGYTGWKHFCIGSTAERVVRAAPCPVLVVREKEHQFC
jgi:nucleotide-binding universal stress UspA family protein